MKFAKNAQQRHFAPLVARKVSFHLHRRKNLAEMIVHTRVTFLSHPGQSLSLSVNV